MIKNRVNYWLEWYVSWIKHIILGKRKILDAGYFSFSPFLTICIQDLTFSFPLIAFWAKEILSKTEASWCWFLGVNSGACWWWKGCRSVGCADAPFWFPVEAWVGEDVGGVARDERDAIDRWTGSFVGPGMLNWGVEEMWRCWVFLWTRGVRHLEGTNTKRDHDKNARN